MNLKSLMLLALLVVPASLNAQTFEAAGDAQKILSDADLAQLRGGFELPGGLVVNLGVTTDTRLDGQLVLRTVFTATQGSPTLRVFGRTGDAPTELNLAAGQAATQDGIVQIRNLPGGERVDLAGNSIDVSHIVGQAFGSVLANTGNDRTIDVVTTVDLDLSHATPDLIGSSLLSVEAAAIDSTRLLAH
jgi:hypothetical protein